MRKKFELKKILKEKILARKVLVKKNLARKSFSEKKFKFFSIAEMVSSKFPILPLDQTYQKL